MNRLPKLKAQHHSLLTKAQAKAAQRDLLARDLLFGRSPKGPSAGHLTGEIRCILTTAWHVSGEIETLELIEQSRRERAAWDTFEAFLDHSAPKIIPLDDERRAQLEAEAEKAFTRARHQLANRRGTGLACPACDGTCIANSSPTWEQLPCTECDGTGLRRDRHSQPTPEAAPEACPEAESAAA